MQRLSTLAIGAAMYFAGASPHALPARSDVAEPPHAAIDVRALLDAARGANPLMCALAAQSVRNGGWGDWSDAPVTPLSASLPAGSDDDWRSREVEESEAPLLIESLGAQDACVRELSVRMIGRTRDRGKSMTPGLLSGMTSDVARTRETSALALGMLRPREAVDPLVRALRDSESSVRANSAWALGRIDDGRALNPLVAMLRDADAVVREAAAGAIGRLDSSSVVPALLRVARQDESPRVRRTAVWALAQLDEEEATSEGIGAVLSQDRDAKVREMAAWALGQRGRRANIEVLSTALRRDADEHVREAAAWGLGNSGDRAAADVLGEACASDQSARVRGTAAWALGQLGGGRARRASAGLLRVLNDESDDVRLKAAWALGQIGDSTAVDALQEAMRREQEPRIQRALVRALVKSGARSERALTQLLDSPDEQVREAAVRGLAGRGSMDPWPWPWPRPRPFP